MSVTRQAIQERIMAAFREGQQAGKDAMTDAGIVYNVAPTLCPSCGAYWECGCVAKLYTDPLTLKSKWVYGTPDEIDTRMAELVRERAIEMLTPSLDIALPGAAI